MYHITKQYVTSSEGAHPQIEIAQVTRGWAGPTLKNERAEVGTPARGGAKRIRPSGSQRFARRASVVVLDTLQRSA